jgi:predicted small metal-binding protein
MKCAFRARSCWEEDVVKKTGEYIEELSDSVHG